MARVSRPTIGRYAGERPHPASWLPTSRPSLVELSPSLDRVSQVGCPSDGASLLQKFRVSGGVLGRTLFYSRIVVLKFWNLAIKKIKDSINQITKSQFLIFDYRWCFLHMSFNRWDVQIRIYFPTLLDLPVNQRPLISCRDSLELWILFNRIKTHVHRACYNLDGVPFLRLPCHPYKKLEPILFRTHIFVDHSSWWSVGSSNSPPQKLSTWAI